MKLFSGRGLCVALALIGLSFLAQPVLAQSHHRASQILDTIQPDLRFDNVPLSEALDFIRDTSSANVYVDWKSLEAVNVDRDSLINIHLHNVTLRKALTVILNEAGAGGLLTFFLDDNVLEITTQAKADSILFTMVYPVQDLLITVPNFQPQDVNGVASSLSSGGGSSQQLGGGNSSTSLNSGGGSNSFSSSSSSATTDIQTQKQMGTDLVTLIMETVRPEIWRQNGGTSSITFFNGNLIVTAPRSVQEAIGGSLDN
jgi:hypothetical protein